MANGNRITVAADHEFSLVHTSLDLTLYLPCAIQLYKLKRRRIMFYLIDSWGFPM